VSFASQDWRLLVLAFFALLFVLLTVYLKFANRKVRHALLKVIPTEIEFASADAAQFPALDKDELARLTSEMEKLGFEWLRDYTSRLPGKPAPRGFARLMVHRPERCFAEIMATSQAIAKNLSPRVAINSFLENDWDLGTSNVAPERGQYFMQLPRVLRMRYSDAEPAELWKRHLERRAEILEGLDIKPLSDLSVDSYFQRIRKRMAERRQRMQSRQPIDELPAATALAGQRHYEWLGDFPKQRQRQPRRS
jgi:hypothetical protein